MSSAMETVEKILEGQADFIVDAGVFLENNQVATIGINPGQIVKGDRRTLYLSGVDNSTLNPAHRCVEVREVRQGQRPGDFDDSFFAMMVPVPLIGTTTSRESRNSSARTRKGDVA